MVAVLKQRYNMSALDGDSNRNQKNKQEIINNIYTFVIIGIANQRTCTQIGTANALAHPSSPVDVAIADAGSSTTTSSKKPKMIYCQLYRNQNQNRQHQCRRKNHDPYQQQ
mmetsp:Transcript_58716/g.66510  ORF Transcript_58716/g.66510 Transcript_58716/m.66510 type:complete len:111 (+) Transcript_58716:93-425(+)